MNHWPETEHFNPKNERMLPVLVYDPTKNLDRARLLWLRKDAVESLRQNGVTAVFCFGQLAIKADLPAPIVRACVEAGNWEIPEHVFVSDESKTLARLRAFVTQHLPFASRWLPEQRMKKIPNPQYFPGAIRVPDFRGITSVQMPQFRCGAFSKSVPGS